MYTEVKTQTRTVQILKVMTVLSWIAFIGLAIKAGSVLVSYVVSYINPEATKNMYMKLNLEAVRAYDFWQYSYSVSMIFVQWGMKAFVLFLVIKALGKVNLKNPFTTDVAHILEKISYVLFIIWAIAILNNLHAAWLEKVAGIPPQDWAADEFIFMAGLIFIISQMFKRGVEIQTENDLTV